MSLILDTVDTILKASFSWLSIEEKLIMYYYASLCATLFRPHVTPLRTTQKEGESEDFDTVQFKTIQLERLEVTK